MNALLLLAACLAAGMIVARWARPPIGLAQGLNWWVINIALPALVLELIPQLHLEPSLWFLAVSQWVVFGGAWWLFATLGRARGWSRARIGALTLVCGLGNTSFMGYPLLEALRGAQGLALGVVADQLGCFIMLSVGGVAVTAIYGQATARPRAVLARILLFPAFVALLLGVLVNLAGGWPAAATDILHRVGQTLSPLALFSVGLRLRLKPDRALLGPLGAGLAWKLLAAPAMIAAAGIGLGIGGGVLAISSLQAAMAPMISAAILADQHRLEPDLANTVLGAGILLSFVTVPAWNAALIAAGY